MATYPCENCRFRAHYDKNPKSVLGRLWRWHINFCPGFKAYFTHQDEETKDEIKATLGFTVNVGVGSNELKRRKNPSISWTTSI